MSNNGNGNAWALDIETFGEWERVPLDLRGRIERRAAHNNDTRHPRETCSLFWTRAEVVTVGLVRLVDPRTNNNAPAEAIALQRIPPWSGESCNICGCLLEKHSVGMGPACVSRDGENTWFLGFHTERDLLSYAWNLLDDDKDENGRRRFGYPPIIATWNGHLFDAPFVLNRSRINRIAPLGWDHVDVARLVFPFDYHHPPASFEEVCLAYGLESPKGDLAGAGVADAWRKGEARKIATYCLRDTSQLATLYPLVANWRGSPGGLMFEEHRAGPAWIGRDDREALNRELELASVVPIIKP